MSIRKFRPLFFWLAIITGLLIGGRQVAPASLELPLPVQVTSGALVISEFVATNNAGLTDADGDTSDWIELYNRSAYPLNLAGWALTDDPAQPEKWTFPNRTLAGGAYLVIFASGKDRKPTAPELELHTNFSLSRDGEFLGLYNLLDGRFEDVTPQPFPEQMADIAYGRAGNIRPAGRTALPFNYLGRPTPGAANDAAQVWAGRVAAVAFSRPRGFYETPFTLELSTETPAAMIYYTLDGSEPDETHGLVYTAPIPIERTSLVRAMAVKPGLLPAPSTTHSYIFLDNVLAQPPDPPGFPPVWGVYGRDYDRYRKGEPVPADYEMDPEIVNHPVYGPQLKAGLAAIPSISLVTDIQHFDIYGAPRSRGLDWERPTSVEFIDPQNPGRNFQSNAGLRIQGGFGRWEFMPKHSFRLFFREKYGAGQLAVPFFPGSPLEEFNTLVLRGGVGESYAGFPGFEVDYRTATYARDEWLRASQIAISGVGSHGMFVHLYLNGLYWGLYNVVERPDAAFMSAYLGGDREAWYAVNHAGPISGDGDRFNKLHELARAGDLANPEQYAAIRSYLDTAQFSDYLILNWYAGNVDWLQKNWYAGVRNPAGRVNYFVWDGEGTWAEGARIFWEEPRASNMVKPLFDALMQNPDFRMELADRLYKHLFNGGELTDARSQARWLAITNVISPAIVGEAARWGDTRNETPITPADWQEARATILARMEGNAAKLVRLMRAAGYYPPLDPPVFNQPGGLVTTGFTVTMTAAEGDVYYTTNGADPRLPVTGAAAPEALVYQTPPVLTTTTTLKARTRIMAGEEPVWSALNQATFSVAEQESRLRITEIMYNPPEGSDYEFIEVKNTGDTALNLANIYFEGIRFTFPPGMDPLPPGAIMVLVRRQEAFAGRYPGAPVGGVYEGRLANQGETITLKSPDGRIIQTITYDDENGWPISPDGRGDSLVIVDPEGNPDDPKNWRASEHLYGSPGVAEIRRAEDW